MNTPWGMFAIVRILDTYRSYPQEEGILLIPTLVSHTTSFPLILLTTLPLFRRLCSSAYVILSFPHLYSSFPRRETLCRTPALLPPASELSTRCGDVASAAAPADTCENTDHPLRIPPPCY